MAKTYAFSDRQTAVKLRSIAESSRNRPTQETAWTQPQTTYPLWACGPTSFVYCEQDGTVGLSIPFFTERVAFVRADSIGNTFESYYSSPYWWPDGQDILSAPVSVMPAHLITGNCVVGANAAAGGPASISYTIKFKGKYETTESLTLASGYLHLSSDIPASQVIPLHGIMPLTTGWNAGGTSAPGFVEVIIDSYTNVSSFTLARMSMSLHAQSTCLSPAWMVMRPLADSNGNQLFDNDGNPLFGQFSPGGGGGTQAPAGLNEPPE